LRQFFGGDKAQLAAAEHHRCGAAFSALAFYRQRHWRFGVKNRGVGEVVPQYTSIVTLLVVLFYFFIATRVPLARRKFNVQLPAISGHPEFERVFRVHQNTLEWMPTFILPLWLCAMYLSDAGAAALGVVWIVGRAIYYVGYVRDVKGRIPGFFLQSVACFLLIVGAIVGMVMRFGASS
jgi:glutathione S-transferase